MSLSLNRTDTLCTPEASIHVEGPPDGVRHQSTCDDRHGLSTYEEAWYFSKETTLRSSIQCGPSSGLSEQLSIFYKKLSSTGEFTTRYVSL